MSEQPLTASILHSTQMLGQPRQLPPGGQKTAVGAVKDYAGVEWSLTLVNMGSQGMVFELERLLPSGQFDLIAHIPPAAGWKPEVPFGSVYLDGPHFVANYNAHPIVSTETNRPFARFRIVIPSLAVPFPSGVNPRQGGGAPTFGGTTDTGGDEVDYTQITEIVRSELVAHYNETRPQRRQDIMDKSRDGTIQAIRMALGYDATPSGTPALKDQWWQKMGERIYSAVKDALSSER
jgi:hypothetical protein